MKNKLAILLWAATVDQPQLCATPFIHAAAAAAMDCEVEIHFSGPSVRLLVDGVASAMHPWPDNPVSLLDIIRQATNLDVKLMACAMALKGLVAPDEKLIPEYDGTAAASAFLVRTLDPDWSTLVY